MRLALLFLTVALLAAQTPVEPPVLPEGQFCQHRADHGPAPAHPCACQRECKPSEDEDGHQTIVVVEDAHCAQWCHKEHCHCPMKGCD